MINKPWIWNAVAMIAFAAAITFTPWTRSIAQVSPTAPPVGQVSGTTSCATGAGTTCNSAVALPINFGSTTGFTCSENLYGGTPASGPNLNDWNTSGSGVTIYLVNGVTSTTYTIAYLCSHT